MSGAQVPAGSPRLDVLRIGDGDVDDVMRIETRVYPFPWTRGNFVDSIAAGYDAWRFVEASGRIVGYAVVMWAVDEVHLLNLAVDAPWQGRGLGERLLRWVMADTAGRGAVSLLLEVRPSNPRAIALYERVGLSRIGTRRGYYPAAAGTREDAVVMRIGLPAVAGSPRTAGSGDAG